MAISPSILEDDERLDALRKYNILDSLPESDYEAITELAAYICQTPIALISFVDEQRQWFKSNHGLMVRETPREVAFCAYNIIDPSSPLVVEDARLDERFVENPLVTGDPHIVFYAGMPLVDADGFALGSLCVIDKQVRQLDAAQLASLKNLARQVVNLLALRKANRLLLESKKLLQVEAKHQSIIKVALTSSEARFKSLIEEAPVATCLFVGREMIIEVANEPMLTFWGKSKAVLGKPLAQAVPELVGQPFLGILDHVFTTGVPYEAKAAPADLEVDGVLGRYYFDFTYKPLRNAEGEVYAVMDMAVDVTQQVLSQQRLEASQQQLLGLFEQSPVGIAIICKDNLTFRMVNPFYGYLVGRDPEQMLGKSLLEALPELAGQGFDDLLRQVIATGVPYIANEVAVELLRNDQLETIYIDLAYQPQRAANSERIAGILVVATDVTQQVITRRKVEESEARYRTLSEALEVRVQARTQELLTANQDLQRSNENLQQFAYIASHDLQEPLRKIQSFSSLLQIKFGQVVGQEGLSYLSRMSTAGERMSALIKDLLTYSQISTRQQAFGAIALNEVIDEVLNTLDWEIKTRQAQIQIPGLSVVNGDKFQLEQLFQNLLSNALKFTSPEKNPHIELTCSVQDRSELPAQVRPVSTATRFCEISVSDQGVGFDTKYLDRIFQVFQRLHGKDQFPGTGVGLAICQQVVENHGGAITATSTPGQGSTFSVYLPV